MSSTCWMYVSESGPYASPSLVGLLLNVAADRPTTIERVSSRVFGRRRDQRVTEKRPEVVQILLEFDIDQPRAVEVAMAEEIHRGRALLQRAEAARELLYMQVVDSLAWAKGKMAEWRRLADLEVPR